MLFHKPRSLLVMRDERVRVKVSVTASSEVVCECSLLLLILLLFNQSGRVVFITLFYFNTPLEMLSNVIQYYAISFCRKGMVVKIVANTTYSDGSLGSGNDEERSEMRYVMRIAELRESSNLRTHTALSATC